MTLGDVLYIITCAMFCMAALLIFTAAAFGLGLRKGRSLMAIQHQAEITQLIMEKRYLKDDLNSANRRLDTLQARVAAERESREAEQTPQKMKPEEFWRVG